MTWVGEQLALVVHHVFHQLGLDLGRACGLEAGVMHAAQADGVEVLVLAVFGEALVPVGVASRRVDLVVPRAIALGGAASFHSPTLLRSSASECDEPITMPHLSASLAFSGTALKASEPGCIAGHSEFACSRSSSSKMRS